MGIRGARNLATPANAIGPVTATGTPVAKTSEDRWALNINLENYGVVGDGVTDDTAAFNLAFQAVRNALSTGVVPNGVVAAIHFVKGRYYLAGSINATGIIGLNFTIYGNGAVLLGRATGKPVLDLLGSRFFTVRDIVIDGDETLTPSYGIQTGMVATSASASSGEQYFDRVSTEGNYSKASFYNYGCEIVQFNRCMFVNRSADASAVCMVQDAHNEYDITSEFITQNNSVGQWHSHTDMSFDTCEFRRGVTGKAVRLIGDLGGFEFHNCYAVSIDSACFEIYKSLNIRHLHLGCHCEVGSGILHSLLIDTTAASADVVIKGLRIVDLNVHAATSVIGTTGGSRKLTILGLDMELDGILYTPKCFTNGGQPSTDININGIIRWNSDAKALDLSEVSFNGIVFVNDESTLVDSPQGSYMIIAKPDDASGRAMRIKGYLRVSGSTGSADDANYVELRGSATGSGAVSILGQGVDVGVALILDTAGTGRITLKCGGTEGATLTSARNFGIGTGSSVDRRLHAEEDNASNNTVTPLMRLTHTTSGTPGAGIGVAQEYEVETSASNNEIGAVTEIIAVTATATAEVFEQVFKLMSAGAAATEAVRMSSVYGIKISVIKSAADDAAANTAGVPVGGLYHTSGAVKVRLS